MSPAPKDMRLAALRRFGFAITVLNVAGHTVLGFEQSWAQPLVSVATAYVLELIVETLDSRAAGRRPRYAGGVGRLVDFLLPGHITGLACAMLLYSNDRLLPIMFATAVAVASKYLVRVPVRGKMRHVLNPSNIGITAVLLLFPWVGIAPPYHFTENLVGAADWILPGVFIVVGTLLNTRFTRKLPLILAWVSAFVLQGLVRAALSGTAPWVPLLPMTGVAFLLFTFYMVTDPATTPFDRRGQIMFGGAVGLVYGVLTAMHIVFGLFFALTIVCTVRGAYLQLVAWQEARARDRIALEATPSVGAEAAVSSPGAVARSRLR
jgi:hypothetical protein